MGSVPMEAMTIARPKYSVRQLRLQHDYKYKVKHYANHNGIYQVSYYSLFPAALLIGHKGEHHRKDEQHHGNGCRIADDSEKNQIEHIYAEEHQRVEQLSLDQINFLYHNDLDKLSCIDIVYSKNLSKYGEAFLNCCHKTIASSIAHIDEYLKNVNL